MFYELPKISYEQLKPFSFEKLLFERRSIRSYYPTPLSIEEISKLCFAAYGLRNPFGFKTVPSAGALYPMKIYLFLKEFENIRNGIFVYFPEDHALKFIFSEDILEDLSEATLRQDFIKDAPLIFFILADFEKTTSKYGKRGVRYVIMEAGHISQNIYLMAAYLGLGTVTIGAFIDDLIKIILKTNYFPLYIMPVGYPRE